jgi:ankyrin repeat protein
MSETATFFEAIRSGDLSQVKSLLDANPSLSSSKNESGASALLMSIYTGHHEIRELLLARGATLELHEAAAAGNLDGVKQFVEKNRAAAKSFSPDGFPIFALACFFGHFDTARYLARQGADIHAAATNGTGYNALTAAVAAGHTSIVEWLLASGVDANYRYGAGYTPLLTAATNGHLQIVKLLVAHAADLHATTNDGKSAIALASERKHLPVAEFLRESGA